MMHIFDIYIYKYMEKPRIVDHILLDAIGGPFFRLFKAGRKGWAEMQSRNTTDVCLQNSTKHHGSKPIIALCRGIKIHPPAISGYLGHQGFDILTHRHMLSTERYVFKQHLMIQNTCRYIHHLRPLCLAQSKAKSELEGIPQWGRLWLVAGLYPATWSCGTKCPHFWWLKNSIKKLYRFMYNHPQAARIWMCFF